MQADTFQQMCQRTVCDQNRASMKLTFPTNVALSHGVMGIVKEGGELLSLLEKYIWYGQPLDKLKIKDELGDVLWYIALVCNTLGIRLEDIFDANQAKLKIRFPEKYMDCLAVEEGRNRKAEEEAIKLCNRHRTVAEILEARANTAEGGCCDRFANQQSCDCLTRAQLLEKNNED